MSRKKVKFTFDERSLSSLETEQDYYSHEGDSKNLELQSRVTLLNTENLRLQNQLSAARNLIRLFVYPNAVMTTEQKEAWEKWNNA